MRDMVRLLEAADIRLLDDVDAAKVCWFRFRVANGLIAKAPLLSPESANMKLTKSGKVLDFPTYGLSLAPHKRSGEYNVCRYATACADACIAHSGNGRYAKIASARSVKTRFLGAHPSEFVTILTAEIDHAVKRHGTIACRLNVYSDITWESIIPWLFDRYGDFCHFYDYSKYGPAARPGHPNYDLTRSASERSTDQEIKDMLGAGERVAVCIDWPKKGPIPKTHLGYTVVDGDQDDARFREEKGVVVLLRPKGQARKYGFVRPQTD